MSTGILGHVHYPSVYVCVVINILCRPMSPNRRLGCETQNACAGKQKTPNEYEIGSDPRNVPELNVYICRPGMNISSSIYIVIFLGDHDIPLIS